MSTISLATHIFQDLLFSLLFKCIFFFQNPHTGVPQSHHYPFKAFITSFQNASVLEHSQSTSWRVHFLTCHTCIFVLVKMDLELWTRFLKKKKKQWPSFYFLLFYSLFAYLQEPRSFLLQFTLLLLYYFIKILFYTYYVFHKVSLED